MSPAAAKLERTATLTNLEESLKRADHRLPLQAEAIPELAAHKQAAWERYEALGYPTRRLEAWKFAPIHQLGKANLGLTGVPGTLDAPLLKQAGHLVIVGDYRLAFTDGYYSPKNSALPESDNSGLTVSDLRSAFNDQPENVLATMKTSLKSDDSFDALNNIFITNGSWIDVKNGVDIASNPIQISCFNGNTTSEQATFQQHSIKLGAEVKATVFVQLLGLPANVQNRLMHQLFHLNVADNAQLDLVILHDDCLTTGWQMLSLHGHVAKGATVNLTTVAVGMGIARHNIQLHLDGETAHVNHRGITVLQGDGQAYSHSEIHHHVAECTSDQLIKTILSDKAINDFDGTIVVDKQAQLTDAAQLSKTLLLSDKAKTYARPQLRIDADDVKCAHGATVGQLNPDELFYLASRGLGEDAAQCLLTFGFVESGLDTIKHEGIHKYLTFHLLGALGQSGNPIACNLQCHECKD